MLVEVGCRNVVGAYLVETEVAALETPHASQYWIRLITGARHLLPRLVLVPLLASSLPLDQAIDLSDSFSPVNGVLVHAALEQSVHVKLAATARTMTQELEDAF